MGMKRVKEFTCDRCGREVKVPDEKDSFTNREKSPQEWSKVLYVPDAMSSYDHAENISHMLCNKCSAEFRVWVVTPTPPADKGGSVPL